MSQPVPAPVAPATLSAGHVVGARFEVEKAVRDDALGSLLRAKDQKTKRAILLRVLSPALFAKPEAVEALRNELKTAAALMHKNICSTFGTGVEKSGARFVATEWLEGPSLRDMVAQKTGVGAARPLAESAGIVAQVAEALGAIHQKNAVHGGLRPAVVWPAPKVKLAEVGVAAAVLKAGGAAAFGESEASYLAPEVRSGSAPTAASDVFGLGGVFYALVCGRLPTEDFVPPSQAHPEGTPEADAFLFKCLSGDPAQRFASASDARAALLALAPGASGATRKDPSGIDIDISVDEHRRSKFPPSANAGGVPTPPPNAIPQIGQRVSIHEDFRASMPAPIPKAAPLPFDAPAAPVTSAHVDLGALISKIGENDAPRWMVTKDGLDHGPFSGRELVGLIGKGEVLGESLLHNMDTGERKKVKEHPDFVEFVEQWRLKKQGMDEQHAIVRSAKVETASNFAKFMVAGAVVLAVGVVATGFFLSRQAETERAVAAAGLADLYERGEVEIEGTAGILEDPPRGGGRRGGRRGGGGGGGGGAGSSYEDAMNEVVDLGSATGSGGEGRLSPAQVAGVMNGHINQLFTCVSAELRNGGSLSRVRLDIAIAGSGSVLGTSVRAGSPEFQRCIASRVASIRFPSFGAPRMGASYSFSVD